MNKHFKFFEQMRYKILEDSIKKIINCWRQYKVRKNKNLENIKNKPLIHRNSILKPTTNAKVDTGLKKIFG